MTADVYNTTVNINGNCLYSSSFSPGYCCCRNMYSMNSCFGFGYGGIGNGIGVGLGFAVGMAAVPLLPGAFKAIGKGLSWFGKKVIAPAASFVWNKAIKPAATFVYNKALKPIGKGVKNLWNKIFHKKSKAESAS